MTKKNVTVMRPQRKPAASVGLGLDHADLSRFLRDDVPPEPGHPEPMELDLSLIDEDPNQPLCIERISTRNNCKVTFSAKTQRSNGHIMTVSAQTSWIIMEVDESLETLFLFSTGSESL